MEPNFDAKTFSDQNDRGSLGHLCPDPDPAAPLPLFPAREKEWKDRLYLYPYYSLFWVGRRVRGSR